MKTGRSDLKLLVTVDVEEEGLFRGQYKNGKASVDNVSRLSLLDPIFKELNIHPTLFVTYQVANHEPCHDFLLQLRDRWGGEIGAHLHHWNTPPIKPLPFADPIPSQCIPSELLKSKLEILLESLSGMGVEPSSFRMGRFSLSPRIFSLLESANIRVDSSIVPTRKEYGGPAYLAAPVEPYFPDPENLSSIGNSSVLEIPLTILPILPNLDSALEKISSIFPASDKAICWFSKHIGSLPAQPMAVGINRLKSAVRLHRLRGGNVVTIFFHSSELMPGISPRHPTQHHVDQFLKRLRMFLRWMSMDMGAVSMTLTEYRESL